MKANTEAPVFTLIKMHKYNSYKTACQLHAQKCTRAVSDVSFMFYLFLKKNVCVIDDSVDSLVTS